MEVRRVVFRSWDGQKQAQAGGKRNVVGKFSILLLVASPAGRAVFSSPAAARHPPHVAAHAVAPGAPTTPPAPCALISPHTGISLRVATRAGQPGTRVGAQHFGSHCETPSTQP